jgi:hypothetical protein
MNLASLLARKCSAYLRESDPLEGNTSSLTFCRENSANTPPFHVSFSASVYMIAEFYEKIRSCCGARFWTYSVDEQFSKTINSNIHTKQIYLETLCRYLPT